MVEPAGDMCSRRQGEEHPRTQHEGSMLRGGELYRMDAHEEVGGGPGSSLLEGRTADCDVTVGADKGPVVES
jgi:hypothetical protein